MDELLQHLTELNETSTQIVHNQEAIIDDIKSIKGKGPYVSSINDISEQLETMHSSMTKIHMTLSSLIAVYLR